MIAKLRAMLRRKLVKRLNAPDIPMALERLARRGVDPKLIFDVREQDRGELGPQIPGPA